MLTALVMVVLVSRAVRLVRQMKASFWLHTELVCWSPVAWLDHLPAKSSCINVLVVLVARSAVPPLCQAVRCTFNLW